MIKEQQRQQHGQESSGCVEGDSVEFWKTIVQGVAEIKS